MPPADTAVPLGGWQDDAEQAGPHAAFRHWLDWQPEEFDAAAKPVQGSLFAEPDRYGTPDMFADQP